MRFPAALFFCFSVCLIGTSCEKDDDIEQMTMIDCATINTFDTMMCTALNTSDSVTYVNAFLGSWYLAASQNSGFGGGSTECVNFTEAESPYRFTFNNDNTWSLIDTENSIDTTLGWTVYSNFGDWSLNCTTRGYTTPVFSHQCDGKLVIDSRPLDGPLRVYSKVN